MAETKSKTKDEKEEKEGYSDDSISYEDKGDHWLAHDKRLGGDVVTAIPKTQRDVPLPDKEQKELAERIKAENEAEDVRKEAAETQPEPPPAEKADVTVSAKGAE